MEFPWKKSKTPQQINREQKKQDSEAHSRMDGIYAELEQAKMAGYNKKVPAEDQVIFDNYFKNAILLAKEPKTVRFDTEKIDQLIKDSVLILENAQGCGTSETINLPWLELRRDENDWQRSELRTNRPLDKETLSRMSPDQAMRRFEKDDRFMNCKILTISVDKGE